MRRLRTTGNGIGFSTATTGEGDFNVGFDATGKGLTSTIKKSEAKVEFSLEFYTKNHSQSKDGFSSGLKTVDYVQKSIGPFSKTNEYERKTGEVKDVFSINIGKSKPKYELKTGVKIKAKTELKYSSIINKF